MHWSQKKKKLRGVWYGMLKRCYKTYASGYKNYGARGIGVCYEWRKSFEPFYRWALKTGYEPGLSIDRIDNNGDYSPDNCRWATARMQANNKRDTDYMTLNGVTYSVAMWAEKHCMPAKVLRARLKRGMSPEDALFTPLQKRRKSSASKS